MKEDSLINKSIKNSNKNSDLRNILNFYFRNKIIVSILTSAGLLIGIISTFNNRSYFKSSVIIHLPDISSISNSNPNKLINFSYYVEPNKILNVLKDVDYIKREYLKDTKINKSFDINSKFNISNNSIRLNIKSEDKKNIINFQEKIPDIYLKESNKILLKNKNIFQNKIYFLIQEYQLAKEKSLNKLIDYVNENNISKNLISIFLFEEVIIKDKLMSKEYYEKFNFNNIPSEKARKLLFLMEKYKFDKMTYQDLIFEEKNHKISSLLNSINYRNIEEEPIIKDKTKNKTLIFTTIFGFIFSSIIAYLKEETY